MKVVTVRRKCPNENCGGELKGTGHGITTGWNTAWGNKCNECHKSVDSKHSYPYEYNKYEPEELVEEWEQ